jgi:hypothetical protein
MPEAYAGSVDNAFEDAEERHDENSHGIIFQEKGHIRECGEQNPRRYAAGTVDLFGWGYPYHA